MERAKPRISLFSLVGCLPLQAGSSLFKPRAGPPDAEGSDDVVVHIQDFDVRVRCKFIAAGSEFQGRGNFLRSDEKAARVIAIVRECVRVILPAVLTLPKSVPRATQSGTRTRTNTIFRHRAARIKREQTRERRHERVASLTINWRNHRPPHALDGSFGWLSRSDAGRTERHCGNQADQRTREEQVACYTFN